MLEQVFKTITQTSIGVPLHQCFGRDLLPLVQHGDGDQSLPERVRQFVTLERTTDEYAAGRQRFTNRPTTRSYYLS